MFHSEGKAFVVGNALGVCHKDSSSIFLDLHYETPDGVSGGNQHDIPLL